MRRVASGSAGGVGVSPGRFVRPLPPSSIHCRIVSILIGAERAGRRHLGAEGRTDQAVIETTSSECPGPMSDCDPAAHGVGAAIQAQAAQLLVGAVATDAVLAEGWLTSRLEIDLAHPVFAASETTVAETAAVIITGNLPVEMSFAMMPLIQPAFHSLIGLTIITGHGQRQGAASPMLAERVAALTRDAVRTGRVDSGEFPGRFILGIVRIGGTFFMSSVEVEDRGARKGYDHLFQVDAARNLVADLHVRRTSVARRIDYDGVNIVSTGGWRYQPDGVDGVSRRPEDDESDQEGPRFADHMGAIVGDATTTRCTASSWGSQQLLSLDARRR